MLETAVLASVSYAGVLRALGLRQTGGSQARIKQLVNFYGLDTAHFLGIRANCGPDKRGGPAKRTAAEILRIQTRLTGWRSRADCGGLSWKFGRPHRCEVCGLRPVWNGRLLVLQIDHKNGKKWDHRPENVRFICPTCHSQTPTFGAKNKSLVRVMEQVDVPA